MRAGQLAQALEDFQSINSKDVVRGELPLFANLARRLGQTELALRVLRPFVRPDATHPTDSHVEEKLEYAMALIKLGAINEGLKLLEGINPELYPNRFLYGAFGCIYQWNYREAAQLLEKYCAHTQVPAYSRLTAQANLLSCYQFIGDTDHAFPLIDELLLKTRESGALRLRRNILTLAAQAYIHDQKWSEAVEALHETSNPDYGQASGLDKLLNAKWSLILDLHREGASAELKARFELLIHGAVELKNYETLRDLDFYRGLFFGDAELLVHVYFGSPYDSYKTKIQIAYEERYSKPLRLPSSYAWKLGGSQEKKPSAAPRQIDVLDGRNSYSDHRLKPGQLLQKYFSILTRDFYRPLSLHQIHDEIFQEHYFNPVTTPKRIHQLTHRLNAWLKDAKVPLEICSKNNFLEIQAHAPVDIVVGNLVFIDNKLAAFLSHLHSKFSNISFTSLEVAAALKIPPRSATRLLKAATDQGFVLRLASGPKTRFALNTKQI